MNSVSGNNERAVPHAVSDFLLVDDNRDYATRLSKLLKQDRLVGQVVVCLTAKNARKVTQSPNREHRINVKIIDLDLGVSDRRGGVELIGEFSKNRAKHGHEYLIIAMTSHEELKNDALDAGADKFVLKDIAKNDALEILRFASLKHHDQWKKRSRAYEVKLNKVAYDSLYRQLNNSKNDEMLRGAAAQTVRLALSRSFLLQDEKLILTAIEELLEHAESFPNERGKVIDMCLEAAKFLKTGNVARLDLFQWLKATQERKFGVIISLLHDDESGDVDDFYD